MAARLLQHLCQFVNPLFRWIIHLGFTQIYLVYFIRYKFQEICAHESWPLCKHGNKDRKYTVFGHSFLLYLEWSTSFQQRTSAERMHTNIKLFSLTATCIFPNPCCSLAWLLVHQSVRYSPRGKIILLLIKYGAFSAVSFGVASSWPDKNIQR